MKKTISKNPIKKKTKKSVIKPGNTRPGKKKSRPGRKKKRRPLKPRRIRKMPPKYGKKTLRYLREVISRRMEMHGIRPPTTLDQYLRRSDNTWLRDSIIWNFPSGVASPYINWPSEYKSELKAAHESIVGALTNSDEYVGIPEAPELAVIPSPNSYAETRMTEEVARQTFMYHVAQSLAVITEELVPWSIRYYSEEGLFNLFNSNSLFIWDESAGNYNRHFAYFGRATPGDPFRTYAFLEQNNMIGVDRLQTIGNLLEWCRDNLVHILGSSTSSATMVQYWGYEGFPPVERIISGTDIGDGYGVRHWTPGCWGTASFLNAVLRTANIPAVFEPLCSHALPRFVIEEKYLSHGDDPYDIMAKGVSYPARELLIDKEKYNAWFGYGLPIEEICKNPGRRVMELALQYLPNHLLWLYCKDITDGKSHADGSVFAYFKNIYTLEALYAANLWQRMDAKKEDMGGCQNVPYV